MRFCCTEDLVLNCGYRGVPGLLDAYAQERESVVAATLDQAMCRLADPERHWGYGPEADAARAAPVVHLGQRNYSAAVVDPRLALPSTVDLAVALDVSPGAPRVGSMGCPRSTWSRPMTCWWAPRATSGSSPRRTSAAEEALLVRPDAIVAMWVTAPIPDPALFLTSLDQVLAGRGAEHMTRAAQSEAVSPMRQQCATPTVRRMTATAPFINSDMGEGLGLHSFGNDDALLGLVDVINVACGYHAGDPEVMDRTVAAAVERGVMIGAHPGLPDITGFGRRRMSLLPAEVESIMLYQVGALTAFLAKHNAPLNHIKPHGALYGMLAGDPELMVGAARVARQFGVPFFGLAGTAHETVCAEFGVPFVAELYVDLNYDGTGGLIIQRRPEKTDPEVAADRVARAIAGNRVLAVDGTELDIRFDSVCVHSDAPNSTDVATAVRAVLDRQR